MSNKKFRLSTSRLSALFVGIFAAGIIILLTAVYALTSRVLDHEVDVVIQAEVNALLDDYRRGGILQLIETLHRRADNWGRTGAVYLLVDVQGRRIAGNIARWPSSPPPLLATSAMSVTAMSAAAPSAAISTGGGDPPLHGPVPLPPAPDDGPAKSLIETLLRSMIHQATRPLQIRALATSRRCEPR